MTTDLGRARFHWDRYRRTGSAGDLRLSRALECASCREATEAGAQRGRVGRCGDCGSPLGGGPGGCVTEEDR